MWVTNILIHNLQYSGFSVVPNTFFSKIFLHKCAPSYIYKFTGYKSVIALLFQKTVVINIL